MPIRILVCFLTVLLLPNWVFALQTIHLEDGEAVAVNISALETTRIAVKDGRITKVWGAEANLQVLPDNDSGELFVLPLTDAQATFSFFIRDQEDNTYTLRATQADIPSETIMLVAKQQATSTSPEMPMALRDEPYVQRIKRLIKGMAKQRMVIDGFKKVSVNESIALWQEIDLVLRERFLSRHMIGEVYRLTNVTDKEMVLEEREFLTFGQGVKAVAIEQMILQPKQTTDVYLVRDRTGEG